MLSKAPKSTMKKKLIRVVTSDISFVLVKGQLKFLSSNYEVIAVSSAGKLLDDIPNTEGVQTKSIEISRQISLIKDIKALYQLYKFFKKEKPDIVHSMTPKAGLLSMMAAFFSGVPIRIHTFTGLIFPTKRGLLKQILIFMDKIVCICATKIIPEGNGVKNDLLAYSITSKPLEIVANGNINGVNMEFYNPALFDDNLIMQLKEDLNISINDYVFVFAGRLVGDKGINELIKAFSNFNKKFENSKLLLVGTYENTYDPLSPQTINDIKTNKNILNTGWVNDVRSYFAISNCLVFPSYREGFPNVVLQACAMKLPCIVTNINGCNEIITNNENGIIIPIKNTAAIYSAMERLFQMSKKDHETMGEISRNIIVSKFEQQFVWNAILKEYQSL